MILLTSIEDVIREPWNGNHIAKRKIHTLIYLKTCMVGVIFEKENVA